MGTRKLRSPRSLGSPCRKVFTTRPDPAAQRPADLVKRQFTAQAPNRVWVADMTYVPTWSGMAYVAFITDVFSRRIVGWSVKATMTTQALPLDAGHMATWRAETCPGSFTTPIRAAVRLAALHRGFGRCRGTTLGWNRRRLLRQCAG